VLEHIKPTGLLPEREKRDQAHLAAHLTNEKSQKSEYLRKAQVQPSVTHPVIEVTSFIEESKYDTKTISILGKLLQPVLNNKVKTIFFP